MLVAALAAREDVAAVAAACCLPLLEAPLFVDLQFSLSAFGEFNAPWLQGCLGCQMLLAVARSCLHHFFAAFSAAFSAAL